ncbi:hypothetical protein [Puia sp.]|jgi:hypothetical protein|uniref:hypothetical protein n=1 Tax=Puia sp. TaxID=2045100 RepID=UPI002F42889F
MKKLFSVLVILCWLTPPAHSQGQTQQRPGAGGLESMKIGFITNRLNLTPEEAQKFWPIYKQYSNEVRQAYFAYRSDHNELGLEENLLNIRKKYSVEFLKAIPPPKINDFFRAEKDFNVFIQRELQRRQMQGRRFQPVN